MKAVHGTITRYWKNLYAVNANIVGSLTINNWVVSGFSSSNYLTYNNSVSTITSFEQVIRLNVTNVNTEQCFTAGDPYKGLGSIKITTDGKLISYISSNGTSNNIANGTKSSLNVPTGNLWIKYAWDGISYAISLSTNGVDYTSYISISNSNPPAFNGKIGLGVDTGDSNHSPFLGSIDLNESYIKINNDVWWNGLSVVGKTPASVEDYDFYTDEDVYKAVKQVERKYWKRETVEYPSGEVKFESSTASNYNIDLLAGEYEIICVGGGGGGASNASSGGYGAAGGGGSGGYSNETVTLTAGNYTAIVGAGGSRVRSTNSGNTNTAGNGGDSSFGNVIGYHGSGGTAYMVNSSLRPKNCQGNGGAGGSGSTQNGNSGAGTGTATKYNTTVSGGASVYGGYGAGGDGCATNPGGSLQDRTKAGGSGYVKVTCYSEEIITPGTAEDYDFYTDEYIYKVVQTTQSNTNCLTYIPQDIDLELSNGTYTLKADSKVYVPNGFEQDGITPKFDEYVFENDYSSNYDAASAQRAWILDTENNTIYSSVVTSFYSGASAPSGSGRLLWYDTDSNKIKKSEDGGSTWSNDLFSFPIFLGSIENNKISSIDQVFNGFGYIGSTVFVLKGVKGLSPNGRNADGTYKANAWELDRCYVATRTWTSSINQFISYLPGVASNPVWYYNNYVESDSEPTTQTYCLWYNPVTNVSKYRSQTTDNWTTVTQANLLCWVGSDGTTKIASLYDIQPVQPEILYS